MTPTLHAEKTDEHHSSIFNSISPVGGGGDGGDFIHYRTEVVALGLRTLSASRGLSGWVPFI